MKFPTSFQSFPSFWRRWAPRRDSQAARDWRRPRRILRCEVRGPSPGRRINEKLTRGQWWIATESQQIDKNLGIRWKKPIPQALIFAPGVQVLEANFEQNTEKHIFSLWMDRLQSYIHGWEYNFQSSNLYWFYLDIPSIHILAGKHSEWLRINYGDNCGICGGYSHIIHAGLTDSCGSPF